MDLSDLQQEHMVWLHYNFPDQQPWQSLLGAFEEVGELSHAYLKLSQGIRGIDKVRFEEIAEDSLGDIIIFLCGFCTNMGIDLDKVVTTAWDQVKKRDWQKNPSTGAA